MDTRQKKNIDVMNPQRGFVTTNHTERNEIQKSSPLNTRIYTRVTSK